MASETIADIVAEKRHRADEIERDVSAKMASGKMVSDQYARELIADLRREADRIETAWERERQPLTIAEWIDKEESIADIAAVLRRYVLPSLAERLEAAWERERAEIEDIAKSKMLEGTIIVDNRSCGNAAAMRKAQERIYKIASTAHTDFDVFAGIERVRKIAIHALAAPARNCDCYKDADSAYIAFCGYDFAAKDISDNAFIDWLFAPAERKGGNDAGK